MVTLNDVQNSPVFSGMIKGANDVMAAMGYTEHGLRHMGFVCRVAGNILYELGYPERRVELARIAGWLHDVGNCINRANHGITGGALVLPRLLEMGMGIDEACQIVAAIGNHEEQTGIPVSDISAALIIADKIDAHRTRVRRGKYDPADIHDRVNYSIQKNSIEIDKENRKIHYSIVMDNNSSPIDFFNIYMSRMRICERSAAYLGCEFLVTINGLLMSTAKDKV